MKENTFLEISILTILIIYLLLMTVPAAIHNTPENLLKQQGYDINGITVNRIMWSSNCYQTSRPILLENGETCDHWKVILIGATGIYQFIVPVKESN